MKLPTVHILNDKKKLNEQYRKGLVSALEKTGRRVVSMGYFENKALDLRTVAKVLIFPRRPVIASNLRAVVATLCCVWLRGMVILNGLGRNRHNPYLRRIIRILLQMNHRKIVVVQSYADYRYFRRFTAGNNLAWVPGSGGTKRPFGSIGLALTVQRPDKLPLVAESLNRNLALSIDQAPRLMTIVGCEANINEVSSVFPSHLVVYAGRVPQNSLFASGSVFLQPSGYGEGVPHSLVDAIVSGMDVEIDRLAWLQTGLGRLGARYTAIGNGWGKLWISEEDARHLAEPSVTARYMSLFEATV